jgi:RND family efflux transporter MFP subunit
MKQIFFVTAICLSIFTACHKHTENHDQDHDHDHDHDHDNSGLDYSDVIFFHEQQQSKIAFSVDFPKMEYFGQIMQTTGQIESSQAEQIIIPAKTSGTVILNKNLLEGQAVRSKQELLIVSGWGMAEKSLNVQFIEAQTNYQKTEINYNRAKSLAEDKIISDRELLETKSAYETAKALYDNLHYNFSSNGQQVSSPISGFVNQLFVTNGQYVETGQALVSISKNHTLLIKADVPVKYASLLPFIASANIKIGNKVYSLSELNGKILSFGKSVSANNYMLPVIIQIDNTGHFIPGSFVEVFIKTQTTHPVMTLPRTAFLEEQGLYFVYIQIASETFEKREVTLGKTDGIRTEILSGLHTEDKVVTQGAVSIKLAQSVKTINPHAEHAH